MKKWYKSKTMWFNILSIMFAVFQYYADKQIIPIELQTLIAGVINILLRAATTQPLKIDDKNE